jgi:hypothetical protein
MPKKMKNKINTKTSLVSDADADAEKNKKVLSTRKGAWPVGKLACNKADANAGW